MRFLCHVRQNGRSLRHGGGKHDIDRRTDADHVKEDFCADKFLCSGVQDIALFVHLNLCAKSAHALDMLVNRTFADDAAAGKREIAFMKSGKKCAKKIIRSSHFRDFFTDYACACYMRGIDPHAVAGSKIHFGSYLAQDRFQRIDILNMRQIFQYAAFARHDRRGNDGNRGILGSADDYGAFQPFSAFNFVPVFMHNAIILQFSFASRKTPSDTVSTLPRIFIFLLP